jgi:hypothetical protein
MLRCRMVSLLRSRLLLAIAVVAVVLCANGIAHTAPNSAGCGLASSEVWRLTGAGLPAVDLLVGTISQPEPATGGWIGSRDLSSDRPKEPSDLSSLSQRAPPFCKTPVV